MTTNNVKAGKIEQLSEELENLDHQFWTEYADHTSGWQIGLGPVQVRRHLTSGTITWIYIAFCAIAIGVGALATFFDTTRELGVALVVGSIFAMGSFMVQWWAAQVQHERTVHREIFGAEQYREFRRLLHRRDSVAAKLYRLSPDYFEEIE